MPRHRVLLLLLLVTSMGGCQVLGLRTDVDEPQAREVLVRAVGLAAAEDPDGLCGLSPDEASTCRQSVEDFGELRPADGPLITCVAPMPEIGPLRGGTVLVLEGEDAAGEPYVTEFVVYDDGQQVAVLDPVWWSGLHIASYSDDTVTWRFDSGSTVCEDGGLEVDEDVLEPPTGGS